MSPPSVRLLTQSQGEAPVREAGPEPRLAASTAQEAKDSGRASPRWPASRRARLRQPSYPSPLPCVKVSLGQKHVCCAAVPCQSPRGSRGGAGESGLGPHGAFGRALPGAAREGGGRREPASTQAPRGTGACAWDGTVLRPVTARCPVYGRGDRGEGARGTQRA